MFLLSSPFELAMWMFSLHLSYLGMEKHSRHGRSSTHDTCAGVPFALGYTRNDHRALDLVKAKE